MMKFLFYIFIKNWKVKVYSLVVSLGLWLFVLGQRSFIVIKEIPIEYLLDQNYRLEGESKTIELTLEGKRATLKGLDSNNQISVFLDLTDQLTGFKQVKVLEENISLPVGVKLVKAKPEVIDLTLKLRSTLQE